MAPQPTKKTKQFLTDLGSDADLLVRFIKNPDDVMKTAKIPPKDREYIRNCLALEVAKKVLVCPVAYFVHWI